MIKSEEPLNLPMFRVKKKTKLKQHPTPHLYWSTYTPEQKKAHYAKYYATRRANWLRRKPQRNLYERKKRQRELGLVKHCKYCDTTKEHLFFDIAHGTTLRSYCKDCRKEMNRKYHGNKDRRRNQFTGRFVKRGAPANVHPETGVQTTLN